MTVPTSCCVPGDITVTKIPTGYLIGRALAQSGPGPWWEYVAIVATYEEAAQQARVMATTAGRRAWLHKGGDDYEPLPDA
jgi:hypothetical protein